MTLANIPRGLQYLLIYNTEQVRDIANYILLAGTDSVSEHAVASTQAGAPLQFMSLLKRRTVPDEDVIPQLNAYALHMFHSMRMPWDETAYERLFQETFGLPTDEAKKIAAQIDTGDLWKGFWNSSGEVMKKILNWITPDWIHYWSEDPANDSDVLYEFYKMGKAIIEMLKAGRYRLAAAEFFALPLSLNPDLATAGAGDPSTSLTNPKIVKDLMYAYAASRPVPFNKAEAAGWGDPLEAMHKNRIRRLELLRNSRPNIESAFRGDPRLAYEFVSEINPDLVGR